MIISSAAPLILLLFNLTVAPGGWVRIGIFSVALWQIMFCHALDIASAPGRQT